MSTSTEVEQAKLAEQAERYEDMAKVSLREGREGVTDTCSDMF